MIREDLLKKLTVVSPALSDNNLLPILTHMWFTGDTIMAFNDQIGISVPFKSEFKGAVPGKLIMSMLNNSVAVNIDFAHKEDSLEIKSRGNSKFKLATMPPAAFIFEMPEPAGKAMNVNTQEFLQGIDSCLMSVGQDTSIPDQLGVTLIVGDGVLDMYSTNNVTLSYARVALKGKPPFQRAVLPTAFCAQMLRLVGKSEGMKLEIFDDHALLDAGKGVTLFGRLVETDGKLDFAGVLEHHLPKAAHKHLVHIPGKLELILERAVVITEASVEAGSTQVTVQESTDPAAQYKVMKFDSKSTHGEAHDSMQVGKTHPNVSMRIEPRLLKQGFAKFKDKNILITEGCAVMTKGDDHNVMFLIASRSTE